MKSHAVEAEDLEHTDPINAFHRAEKFLGITQHRSGELMPVGPTEYPALSSPSNPMSPVKAVRRMAYVRRPAARSNNNLKFDLFASRNPAFSNLRSRNIKKIDTSSDAQN